MTSTSNFLPRLILSLSMLLPVLLSALLILPATAPDSPTTKGEHYAATAVTAQQRDSELRATI